MRRYLRAVLILSLLLAPARAQTGPQLTQSNVAGGGGVSAQGLTRVEGTVGQASAGAASGGTFGLYTGFYAPDPAPHVVSVVRAGASPANPNSAVGYAVTFSESVTGVDASDFKLTTSNLSGAGVTGVSGAGSTYNVTVDTGTPDAAGATLRLDVVDDDTVVDSGGQPLGGNGTGNGDFNAGEVYAVNATLVRANDASAAEPAAGSTQMLFAVTLSAPAPAGGLSVNYSTADGGANPATGGASCGGAADYQAATGSLGFAAGETFKTVPVTVCADAQGGETPETLTLNLSGASYGVVADAQAVGTITPSAPAGTLLISELRTSGPGGAADDFVELYNNTDSPLTVASADGSAGYGIFEMGGSCGDAPVLVATVPNGTSIPARGHFLAVGAAYSLGSYAAGDTTFATDLGGDRNVAVFSTASLANVSSANRLDAVGFGANSGGVCDLLREGGSLGAVAAQPSVEHSFFRKECDLAAGCTGNPKDTNDNAADFLFADTAATNIAGIPRKLGAPGPEGLASPVRRDNSGVGLPLLDASQSSSVAPNRVRDLTVGNPNTSSFGTLSVRRRVVNNTGAPVTRLRVRVVEMTTAPAAAGGAADVRALTSADEPGVTIINDAATCGGPSSCAVTVKGTTLEKPPAQPSGGGLNSTLSVTLGSPLQPGQSVPVQFLLGVQTTGSFRFYVIVEALP